MEIERHGPLILSERTGEGRFVQAFCSHSQVMCTENEFVGYIFLGGGGIAIVCMMCI